MCYLKGFKEHVTQYADFNITVSNNMFCSMCRFWYFQRTLLSPDNRFWKSCSRLNKWRPVIFEDWPYIDFSYVLLHFINGKIALFFCLASMCRCCPCVVFSVVSGLLPLGSVTLPMRLTICFTHTFVDWTGGQPKKSRKNQNVEHLRAAYNTNTCWTVLEMTAAGHWVTSRLNIFKDKWNHHLPHQCKDWKV